MDWVKDKASAALASFNDVDTACIKATNHEIVVPKEKHVKALIMLSAQNRQTRLEVLQRLHSRMDDSSWTVVLKTLIVVHRLLREGTPQLIGDMNPNYFSILTNFHDSSSTEAYEISKFARFYAKYLGEKLRVYHLSGVQHEYEKENPNVPGRIKELTTAQILHQLPSILNQLGTAVECHAPLLLCGITTPPVRNAFVTILKDALRLFKAVNDGILQILDLLNEFEPHDGPAVLSIYRSFVKESKLLETFAGLLGEDNELQLFDHSHLTLLPTLELHFRTISEGNASGVAHGNENNEEESEEEREEEIAQPTNLDSWDPFGEGGEKNQEKKQEDFNANFADAFQEHDLFDPIALPKNTRFSKPIIQPKPFGVPTTTTTTVTPTAQSDVFDFTTTTTTTSSTPTTTTTSSTPTTTKKPEKSQNLFEIGEFDTQFGGNTAGVQKSVNQNDEFGTDLMKPEKSYEEKLKSVQNMISAGRTIGGDQWQGANVSIHTQQPMMHTVPTMTNTMNMFQSALHSNTNASPIPYTGKFIASPPPTNTTAPTNSQKDPFADIWKMDNH